MSQRNVKGNCCQVCANTHEKCADEKTCEKWQISYEVCVVFGTRPTPKRQTRGKVK